MDPGVVLTLARVAAFVIGLWVVVVTVGSAIRSLVLPRSAPDQLARFVFVAVRRLIDLRLRGDAPYEVRDRLLALYAPLSVVALIPTWLACVLTGYTAMFWALGASPYAALRQSGSSLLTLGFAATEGLLETLLGLSEAAIGLILVALLIAYLPTMYSAFSRREAGVALLEVRAGTPPSAVEMIERMHRLGRLDHLNELWETWEAWFVDVEETHTSLGPLTFYRSPQPDRSWVTASGAVLDAAALAASTLDVPPNPQADLCIRAGYLALRRICDFFGLSYDAAPAADDPISVERTEFDAAYAHMAERGVPLKADRDQAWRSFAGWRVNYDTPLLKLASLTMAPMAPWSSDRAPAYRRPSWRVPRPPG